MSDWEKLVQMLNQNFQRDIAERIQNIHKNEHRMQAFIGPPTREQWNFRYDPEILT